MKHDLLQPNSIFERWGLAECTVDPQRVLNSLTNTKVMQFHCCC